MTIAEIELNDTALDFVMLKAYSHSFLEDFYEPLPEGTFLFKFDWDPTLLFFVLLLILYTKGLPHLQSNTQLRLWQKIAFYVGCIFSILALCPPIDPLSDRLFFVHMIQHMIIVNIGVPLILCGVPFYVILRGMPGWFNRKIYLPIIRSPLFRISEKFFLSPLIALALFEMNYWFWHVPRFYNLALLNDWIHLVEHGMMAFTAFLLWRNIVDPYPLHAPLPIGFRLLYLLAISILDSMLSAALAYSSRVWYAYEGIPMPKWWIRADWSHLDDQQLGGLIMWVIGGIIWFFAMTGCFFVWMEREKARELASGLTETAASGK